VRSSGTRSAPVCTVRCGPVSGSDPRVITATGVLLVGGRSRRFGAPKALAPFEGETLADRAWRLLGAACAERIAVGKAGDPLAVSFPVLDDGAPGHAPIHGVIAGLRAAANEVVVVIPVDCPLLTVEVVQALATAVGVAPTGPLPGAYEKAMLPELEARVARGALSLRGVNPRACDIDEAFFLDADTPDDLAALAALLRTRPSG
jgi:molybdopterin-guanine dinucleotide biosynthesis protein A